MKALPSSNPSRPLESGEFGAMLLFVLFGVPLAIHFLAGFLA
jgi:hypothetical protein